MGKSCWMDILYVTGADPSKHREMSVKGIVGGVLHHINVPDIAAAAVIRTEIKKPSSVEPVELGCGNMIDILRGIHDALLSLGNVRYP